jgi:hypothetical protein
MGEDRLLSAPAHEAKKVGDRVLVTLDISPLNWQSPPYRKREEQMINYLGRRFFFLKGEPSRQLIAPDFQAG